MGIAITTPQPLPLKDGDWWIASRLMRQNCPACGREMFDRPAVLGYVRDLDRSGDQGRENPLWARFGWLVWLSCPLCGFATVDLPDHRQPAVGKSMIARWSHMVGPWVPVEEDTGPLADPARDVRGRQPIPDSLRGLIYARDGYACQVCGAARELAIDHIFPVSKGGSNDNANLRTLCRTCNSRKGAKLPDESVE